MRRKILSLVLALCMVISLLPMTAFAAENNTHTLTVNITGVEVDSATKYGTVSVAKGDNDSSPTEITDASGTVSITEGTDVKLIISIEAPTGYAVDTVKDGNDQALNANKDGNYVLENIDTADYSIAVTYKQVFEIDVTGAADQNNNAVSVEGDATSAAKDEVVTLTVTTADGWQLKANTLSVTYGENTSVTVTPKDDKYTFTMPEADVTVTAEFEKIPYTITTGTVTGGTIKVTTDASGNDPATTANAGDTVTVTATPDNGNEVSAVTYTPQGGTPQNATGSNGTYTFTMPAANVTVGATFQKVTYAITGPGSLTGGSVTTTVGGTTVTKASAGDEVTLVVTPEDGYKLTENSLTVTETEGGANVTVENNKFTMPAKGVTIAAAFEAIPYEIEVTGIDPTATTTVKIGSGSEVTYDAETKPTATIGQTVVVKVVTSATEAEETYGKVARIAGVTGGTEATPGTPSKTDANTTTYTFTMPASKVTAEVTYETVKTYKITIGSLTGGAITSSVVTADKDEDITLTITPDTGYELTALTVGDDTVEIADVSNTYTFKMPEKDVSVSATFAKVDYTISLTPPENGTLTATPNDTANYGDTVNLVVKANDGYEINKVTYTPQDGSPVDATIGATDENGTAYSFTMPASNVTVTATFVEEGSETPDPGPNPGGNGGSGGGSTTPTPPPEEPDPNPPSTGEDVTQTVTPDISEGTASATVDKETADKLVSDAVDNKSENVTVKVDVPADADVNEVKADIPASAVADLASKTNAALTVDTPVGNVTIPNKTLAQLGGTSGNVTVTAAVNEDNSVKVEVQANGSTVGALNGGMKVDLPVSQPTAGTVAVLVDAEGNETILPKSAVDGSEVAVLLENGSATIKFVDNAQSFADTDNHWAKNSIAFVSSRNLFQGMENSNFKADVPMNRAMLVTVLHRLESTPAASGGSFDDVPSDSYYATAAAWAAGKGIVTGDDSGFSGDRSVTREEMAVMLYRYVQTINGNKGTLGSYSGMGGANDVSGWASEAMRWAVGSGIIGGDNSGNLNPGSTATRGEVSQMLMNFVKLITK